MANKKDDVTNRAEAIYSTPHGKHSARARERFLNHSFRCGASHPKHLISLANSYVDERVRELCVTLR